MSLADYMNDIDGGYAERERMAAFGQKDEEELELEDEYDQYLSEQSEAASSNPNTNEEE